MNRQEQNQDKAEIEWKNSLVTLLRNVCASQIKISDIRKMRTNNKQYVIIDGVIKVPKLDDFAFSYVKEVSR